MDWIEVKSQVYFHEAFQQFLQEKDSTTNALLFLLAGIGIFLLATVIGWINRKLFPKKPRKRDPYL